MAQHCEAHEQKLTNLDTRIGSLETAVFKGDGLTHSIKDRVYSLEFALDTVKTSINQIADVMRDKEKDKKKLMLVVIGGSIAFLSSSVIMLVTKLLGA